MKVPNHALDLVKLPKVPGFSVATSDLAEHVQPVQEDVKQKLHKANKKYKAVADKYRKYKVFKVGDEVMIFLKEWADSNKITKQTQTKEVWSLQDYKEDQW